MKHTSCKTPEWQEVGGAIEIPVGWFVCGAYFDVAEPYIEISDPDCLDRVKIPFPKPLAYYLSTHWCGSEYMHELIEDGAKRKVQNIIKSALGL
jgi:hypothetical protein